MKKNCGGGDVGLTSASQPPWDSTAPDPPKLGSVWGLLCPVASFQLSIDRGNWIKGLSQKSPQAAGRCKWKGKMGVWQICCPEEMIAGGVDSVCLQRVERGSAFWPLVLDFPVPQTCRKNENDFFWCAGWAAGGWTEGLVVGCGSCCGCRGCLAPLCTILRALRCSDPLVVAPKGVKVTLDEVIIYLRNYLGPK